MLDQSEYQFLADFIKTESGIILAADRLYFIDSRLSSIIKKFELKDLKDLIAKLKAPGMDLLKKAVINAITTNETLFFRDKGPFVILENKVIPELLEKNKLSKSINVWCAACSTGQEPYSIVMTLLEKIRPLAGWKIHVLGTDINSEVLDKARDGEYSDFEVNRGLSEQMRQRYFDKTDTGWKVKDEIKKYVSFKKTNLLDPNNVIGSFDIVFVRNVIIYFDVKTKEKVLLNVTGKLKTGGALFLGGAEIPYGNAHQLKREFLDAGTLYVKEAA